MAGSRGNKDREIVIRRSIEDALPYLRAFARGLCSNRMEADDIVQSACERALERLDQVTDLSGIRSWLNRIVFTQWQDLLRKRARRRNRTFQLYEYQSLLGQGRGRQTEERNISRLDIRKSLDLLSPDHRVALVLVSMLGYGYEEAAAMLNLPVGTVASRVARARLQLARSLKKSPPKMGNPSPKQEVSL